MKPVLFNKDEKTFDTYGLGEIEALKGHVTRERNGLYQIYLEYPANGPLAPLFKEEMKIKADAGTRTKNQTFEISRIVKNSKSIIKIYGYHISHKLEYMAIKHGTLLNGSASEALEAWSENVVGDYHFDTWSDIDTQGRTVISVSKATNARLALGGVEGSILDIWGGEYEFDNMLIRLHKQMGRKAPTVLEYGRNILSAESDDSIESAYTSVYPFATYTPESGGGGGTSQSVTVTIPELYVDSQYLNLYADRRVKTVDFSNEFKEKNIPTVDKLRELANQYMERNKIGVPKINTKIEYVDLAQTLDYDVRKMIEEIELCDIVPIYYPSIGITDENAKVTQVVYDFLNDRNESVEFGMIGESIRSAMTSNIAGRLDSLESKQERFELDLPKYLVNAYGNKVWKDKPDENAEHKVGDTWFEKNGQYYRIHVWDGHQWVKVIDDEKWATFSDDIKKQFEELDASFDQKLKDIDLSDLSLPDLDKIIERLSRVEQSNNVTAEMIGYDGLTRYNKNRADGQTTREQEFGAGNIEISHNGDGFEAGQTYTVSFSAECVPLVKKQVTVKANQRMPLTVNFSHVYSKLENMSTEITKDAKQAEIELWGAKYDAVVVSDWYKTQTVRVDASETDTVNLELEYREIADGNENGDYWIGYWAENPEFILFGGGNE